MVSFGVTPIKDEDNLDLGPHHLLRRVQEAHRSPMTQQSYNQFGGSGSGHNASINPNELNYSQGFPTSYSTTGNGANGSFNNNSFGDDELLDGLSSPAGEMQQMDFGNMNNVNMSYNQNAFNGFSNTPEGDPIQSPFVHNFTQYRQMQHPHTFGNMHSNSYNGSPLGGDVNNDGTGPGMSDLDARQRLQAQVPQRKVSNTRGPLSPKNIAISMDSQNGLQAQSIRGNGAHHLHKSNGNTGWGQTPNSLASFQSGLSSPLQSNVHGNMNEFLMKGGASMPAKLSGSPSGPVGATMTTTSAEAKRKRRRESHNMVERRRRDNINERIQDLSKLVPSHRLEDDKIRKLISNGTPLSPSLTGLSSPITAPSAQATSSLAGPGGRRAASVAAPSAIAGSITTGLPIEDKDKGPNKGDILNGSVSWTRDLMWMLSLKLDQLEELMNYMADRGHKIPFALTEDEVRMHSELSEVMGKNPASDFTYSRTQGTGLRVPDHTDYKGSPLREPSTGTHMNGGGAGGVNTGSISPGVQLGNGHGGQQHDFAYLVDDEDGSVGEFKLDGGGLAEEDDLMEY